MSITSFEFRAAFKDNLQASLLTVCCSMLSSESGCNLVTSIASFTVISKRWSFSGSEGQLTDMGSRGRTILSQKMFREFRSGQKDRDTEFAGDDSAVLISVCVSASLTF